MSGSRHRARLATVAFVCHGDDVLLKRHGAGDDRFAGRWNGIGGHVEPGEDPRAAARRELREETGLEVADLRLRCVIHESGLVGHAYVVFVFTGSAAERGLHPEPGLELAWQAREKLEALPLVADLAELLPRILAAREPFFVTERFDGGDRLLELCVEGERIDVR